MSFASQRGVLNVHTFPRPPALEKCLRHVKVTLNGVVLAESDNAFWVLETTHPPTYYIPPQDCRMDLLHRNSKSTFCEWKGAATYFDVTVQDVTANSRCWAYGQPTKAFAAIKDHVSFYCGPFACFVNGERVEAQPGNFYGGWMTSDITGGPKGVKGGPGTAGW